MKRLVFVLSIFASLWLVAPADAGEEVSEIDVCRDFSLIARDVMAARQKKKPMSETLPKAMKQIEGWAEKYGLEMGSKEVEEAAAELVIPAYNGMVWPSDPQFNENRQDTISDFENNHFEVCYKALTSD